MRNPLYDPMALAGLAVMRGAPLGDALSQAAVTSHNLQQAQMQQQQQQQAQMLAQRLPQILSEVDKNDPYAVFNTLVQNGIAPNEAALIIDRLTPPRNQAANLNANTFAGPGGVRYQTMMNPETGEMEARQIPGQNTQTKPSLSVSELRINATKLKDLDNEARNAEKELRLLEDSDAAFRQFDKSTGNWTKAGTVASKYLPKGVENILYNEKAQSAKQQIDKLNSQLFQNRVQALGARGTDTAKKEIIKGLPTIELTPEARHDVLVTKKREGFEQILRSKFFNEWAKKNNRDLNGAESAFGALISSEPLIDEKGQINKSLMNQIPRIVNELSGEMAEGMEMMPNQGSTDEQIEDIYAQFEETPLEALEAERARRTRR